MISQTDETFPQGLHSAIRYFADPDKAFGFLSLFLWPDGPTCPHCNNKKHSFISTRRLLQCKECHRQFSITTRTPMEASHLSLSCWAAAIWSITSAKNGVSSCEIARSMEITQKSAWFLLHRVREMMRTVNIAKFAGTVEADEMYFGGIEKNKHSNKKQRIGRGGAGKKIVFGILQRGQKKGESKVRAKVIPDTTRDTLHTEVKEHVEPGSEVFTDAHRGYQGLSPEMVHAWVDHATMYAEGRVHCNGTENFWSLFSMMLHGTYRHLDARHLQSYLNELIFRFNTRKMNCLERFVQTVMNAAGRRLTYRQLCERGLQFMAQ